MAAAPGDEVPTPFAAPVPPATAVAGWSSLPTDLVRRIADCLLDTNDVDCYVDLRAVCHNWRSATDDPRSDVSDPRFHPRFWIVLDDDGAFQSDDSRVLVNTATGRFLRKKLPLPRHYYVVTTTVSGFFVLADRSPPHAARVLNPLIGAVVRFKAPLPRDASVAVFLFCGGTSHNLTVLCDSTRKYYTAVPESKRFAPVTTNDVMYNYMRKAVVGGVYANGGGWASVAQSNVIMEKLFNLSEQLKVHFVKFFSVDPLGHRGDVRCFLLDFGGEVFFITKAWGRVMVLGIEPTEKQMLAPVETVGRYAIFVGHQRCLVVDAAKFPSVEADCVYYTLDVGKFAFIWKHSISDGKDERVFDAIDFVKENKRFVPVGARPFTIIQLLSSYTINLSDSELASKQSS
ncbi:hypothetical protein CFC21_037940 [Triticum aestivum]|uniref:KIB1-4 beta-propeller domain-containing protein n=3 Tax=Triticum TaxID=4564 RepID=A0A9R0RYU1_TRITD|nr:uncharacterized protein LOC123059229 [Triticum aestivum]KAF7025783.1 hypothetical protein CFC21_037940 [Triticum aestivum]VAH68628.1 unnamed protein product [Triticum turgidum subsp. durum]